MGLIYYAIPFFLGTLLLEHWLVYRRAQQEGADTKLAGFTTKDSIASVAMGLGFLAINTVLALLPFAGLAWLYQFRLFDIPVVWWSWVLLLFAEDFCYYWFHRLHHEVRTLWAAHINHHSSTRYNFSTALRQSWTTPFTGFIFWIPLPLLGFPVEMILIQKSISLLYQYWLHTELIGKLGWFGVVFNTPSHPHQEHPHVQSCTDRLPRVELDARGCLECEELARPAGLSRHAARLDRGRHWEDLDRPATGISRRRHS
jgi:sterol desaturase/sphingolipid hydroxylase (fatty acid hydroxylase superfamily)